MRHSFTPPLDENDRIIIEAIRKSPSIEIRFGNQNQKGFLTISSRGFSYDVSNAVRNYAIDRVKNRR